MSISDKQVGYVEFVEMFMKCASEAFRKYRYAYPDTYGFVWEHAFAMWNQFYDQWDSADQFVTNYIKAVESDWFGQVDLVNAWELHGEIIRMMIKG